MEEAPRFENPKLFDHCLALYDLMESKASDSSDGKVYVGALTNLIQLLGLAQSSHGRIVGRMKAMGCIAMLKRGGGKASSVWGLYGRPTIDDFFDTDTTGDARYQRKVEAYDAAMQRISDLNRRVSNIEEALRERNINV